MSIWDDMAKLAKARLGSNALERIDVASVQNSIIPEKGRAAAKRYSHGDEPLGDIDILPEYEFVAEAMRQGVPALFLTGKAGTGKSTLVRWLVRELSDCAVLAPTAIAAVNIGGATIHSLFSLPAEPIDPDREYVQRSERKAVLSKLKYLIIDEVSMVLPNVVDAMDRILQSARRNEAPFGGVSVLFVGDLLQLPPVVSTREEAVYFSHRYRTQYFFSAEALQAGLLPVVLKRVRRQSDLRFIQALDHIRLNHEHRDSVALLNRHCYRDKLQEEDKPSASSALTLVPTNAVATAINLRQLNALENEPQRFEASVTGHIPLDKWNLAVPPVLELKVGAKVIFLKNKLPEYINGDTGEVVGFEADSIRVKKDRTDNVVLVSRESWNRYRYTYDYETMRIERTIIGSFRQFPLNLGWAITIHKSQGMSLDEVTVDLGSGAFCEGQTYVALSRCRTLDGIRLVRPIAMSDVRVDQKVLQFYKAAGISVEPEQDNDPDQTRAWLEGDSNVQLH
ncbi:ATP-dependent DNA helicase [Allohahella marinimesophila]|uniref:DNA helicase Pif1-like DEAD-box helicase domain-containing protein n=1 Tax=Allohahella marinimesophila TaxID=1054972 RepID=A0ABP7PMN0_9GAMM